MFGVYVNCLNRGHMYLHSSHTTYARACTNMDEFVQLMLDAGFSVVVNVPGYVSLIMGDSPINVFIKEVDDE